MAIVRDARGVADMEDEARRRIAMGDREMPACIVVVLLQELTDLRHLVMVEKGLERSIAEKHRELADLQFVADMKRKAAELFGD